MVNERTIHPYRRDTAGEPSEDSYVWVSLHHPDDRELAAIEQEFGLPDPIAPKLRTMPKRPFAEVADRMLIAAVKTASWAATEEAVRLATVQLVLGDHFVISIDDTGIADTVRQNLQADPELAGAGPVAVLPGVVDKAVEGYGPVLAAINDAVEEVEEAVFSPGRRQHTERIYNLSRQLLELRRAMGPLVEMLDRLTDDSFSSARAALRRRFREQRAHLQHLIELANGLSNLLSTMLQAHLTEVSVRQNDDMRRISAWVAIWAVPTLLAGVYGMNFRHMPELEWQFAYPLVLLAMVGLCVTLYRGFRRTGWL
jgi:magnesium transporter